MGYYVNTSAIKWAGVGGNGGYYVYGDYFMKVVWGLN